MTGALPSRSSALLEEGVALLRRSRPQEAWDAFHAVLRLDPANALAHHMIGAMAVQAGQVAMGVESLTRSAALNPADPLVHRNLGNGLRELGQMDLAVQAYDRSLALQPASVEVLGNRAALLAGLGRPDDALADYDRALALDPGAALLHGHRAALLAALGRRDEAILAYERAAALDPGAPAHHHGLAVVLAEGKRHPEALVAFNRAIALRPGHAEAYADRGSLLHELGRNPEALADYDRAIALKADLGHAHEGRAEVLWRLGQVGQALASVRRALALSPERASVVKTLANILFSLGRHEEALAAYDRAVAADPAMTSAWNDRGVSLLALMRLDQAQASFERAYALEPDLPEAPYNIAHILLVRGDYDRGWAAYEARKGLSAAYGEAGPWTGRPEWTGREPIAGRTLLLVGEQGLGDSLQFCRYADLLADRGARVVLQVDKPLVRLLSTLRGAAQVVENSAPPPDVDLHALMMSLPLALGTTAQSIPAAPYLSADRAQAAAFAARMAPRARPRVGLVWSGGFRPDEPEVRAANARRNIPLRLLAPLAEADVEFYSLQKGEPAQSELAALVASGWNGPVIVDWTSELSDFADTAALIEALDLVIAVDTSTAHVAGALGKPVWILNRFDTCWRWLLDRADSPWYPSARLFRQPRFGDWESVVSEVTEALKAFGA